MFSNNFKAYDEMFGNLAIKYTVRPAVFNTNK